MMMSILRLNSLPYMELYWIQVIDFQIEYIIYFQNTSKIMLCHLKNMANLRSEYRHYYSEQEKMEGKIGHWSHTVSNSSRTNSLRFQDLGYNHLCLKSLPSEPPSLTLDVLFLEGYPTFFCSWVVLLACFLQVQFGNLVVLFYYVCSLCFSVQAGSVSAER